MTSLVDIYGVVWYNCVGANCGNYCTFTHVHPNTPDGMFPCTDYCVPCVDGCLTCGSTVSCLTCESDYAFFSPTDCRSCAVLYNTGCIMCDTARCLTCASGYGFDTTTSNHHIIQSLTRVYLAVPLQIVLIAMLELFV